MNLVIPVRYWTSDAPQDLATTICDRFWSPTHFEIALREREGMSRGEQVS